MRYLQQVAHLNCLCSWIWSGCAPRHPCKRHAAMQRLCPRWTVLVLVLSVEAVEAVTQTFHRPPVSSPLSRSEVLALRTAFSAKFGASSGSREPTDLSSGRRLLHGLPMRLTEQIRRDWQLVESDKVQQVKVSPGGPGEAVITWLTQDRRLPSLVEYQSARSVFSRTAQGEVNVYTTQICLPNSQVMADPLLGPPNIPLNYDELTKLLNTSSFLPPESDSWRFLGPNADPWEFLAKTNFCIDYKNPNAYYTSPYIHTVTLRGLGGSTDYSFRPAGSSRSFHFKTPPNAGANAAPMRLGVWADIGITNVSFGVMSKMLDLEPDLLVTVGDLSYADGWAERWDIFGMMMEPLMSSRYHLAVVGNHEIIQNNGVDFIHRYPMPFRQSGAPGPYMFAYESGLLYLIGLPGSYAPTAKGSLQWSFAEEKLMEVDRERTPWVVVVFHTPWYNSNNAHFGEGMKHQWDMEELFYQHGVDLVFNGHVHSYERSFPVYNHSRNECGTTHIVVGDGGNYEGPAIYEGHPPGWRTPQPSWSAFREASYGPGLLTVFNSTHAEWRWHRVACVFENKAHRAVNWTKFTYEGARQSLGRTRPMSAFYWDGVSGPAGGPECATEGDNAEQAYEASDVVMLVRDPQRCPNKSFRQPGTMATAASTGAPVWFTEAPVWSTAAAASVVAAVGMALVLVQSRRCNGALQQQPLLSG
ncbi:unnamed protein product [Durusdinium trenchii]|uniref:Purple acid phosphatase n=1 Tax=Durusdinium trenchii TaxID=1381693 RepID=A0ABP0QCW3_9DINO